MLANQIKPIFTASEELLSQKFYWLNKLSPELPSVNFIGDYVRPSSYSKRNKNINFELPIGLSQEIIKFTNNSNFSIYLLLLATLNVLLQKSTNNHDTIVGSPVYLLPEASRDLGNQLLPLRFHVSNQLTCKDFLLQVKQTVIGAYSHQNYPLDELLEILQLPQSPNRCPFFDIVILLENIHSSNSLINSQHDLTVSFVVKGKSIKGKIDYSGSLFKDEMIEVIVNCYINLIQDFIKNFDSKISDISCLTEDDKYQLLNNFNNNAREYPVNQTLHYLFEKQVEQTPNQIAVVCESVQLTYQQLNEQANQLARFLLDLGVKTGDFIGIFKERNIDFLIAILAVLKAGGAYVPIDSTYPEDRIRYMLSNSEVRFLLTESSCVNSLTDLIADCPYLKYVINLDDNLHNQATSLLNVNIYNRLNFNNLPTANLEVKNQGIDPAYVIYTSGSTGLPKGAIIRHGGAINHIYAQFDALKLTDQFTFLQSAPASSDISVWQFLAPILIGGKTIIVDTETVCNPEKLFKVIREEKLTTVELVPIVLTGLLDYICHLSDHARLLPDLKWMMVTGESVSVDLVNKWLQVYPEIKVVNAYGPSEAADDITQFIIEKPLAENQSTVPIGKPLANLNLYILDSQMNLVPIGVPGEICVSGFGVGLGYWKNEETTKLSFVPNLFSNTAKPLPGTNKDLIYKTGDLGRWLPNGNVEFLGRIDNQVKIRGFRIELGEIETLLSKHPTVRETVVVVREDNPGDKRLVAYIVPTDESPDFDSKQLRNFLKAKLPEYMLPSFFILLEALPLTPSGKVDRRSLPAPDLAKAELAKTFVPPRTLVEETLTRIWAQVLGFDQVGIDDNFFELGGDSLLSIQVIAKANQEGLQLTVKQVFQHQTIAELAIVASTTQMIQAEQGLVTGSVSLTPIESYFFEQNLPKPHHWNQVVLLEVQQVFDPKLLEKVVEQLLIHHDALRLRFQLTESGWKQFNATTDEEIPFLFVDLSDLPADEQESALETTAIALQDSLNLCQGPLVRVALFNLGAKTANRLLVIIHHIVIDTFSWRILVEDLQTAYQQIEQGEAMALPAKTTSFQQWSQLLWEYANSPSVEQELIYWLAESRRRISPLPVDYAGGANTEASIDTVSVSLSMAETQALLYEVPTVYHTQINDFLLTALLQAFSQWTGQKSLLVELEAHGREEIFANVNLSRTVGLFSTSFPVLLDLGDTSHPIEALKTIKEQLRSIPNKGIGYGLLRYVNERPEIVSSLRSLPSAEIVFNYLGQFDRTFSKSSLFRLASESTGSPSSLQNHRSHLLNFNSFVVSGQLQLNCTYSKAIHSYSTIATLAEGFLSALRSMITQCQSSDAGGFTPSDFPLMQLSQDKLDQALGMVEF